LDIPLLFENRSDRLMDVTLAVSCPRDVQVRRVLRRGTMTAEQIATIIAKQMPDAEKRARADYVIRTGLSRFHTYQTVCRLIGVLLP
jgi:dephospho-CoA kinase